MCKGWWNIYTRVCCKFTTESIVKKVWKSVNIWWSYGQEFDVLFFWTHSVYTVHTQSAFGLSNVGYSTFRDTCLRLFEKNSLKRRIAQFVYVNKQRQRHCQAVETRRSSKFDTVEFTSWFNVFPWWCRYKATLLVICKFDAVQSKRFFRCKPLHEWRCGLFVQLLWPTVCPRQWLTSCSTTIVYRTDRQALSTARFCRTGQLATADTWIRTCRISSFCTVAWQLARFQLTRHIARSLGDSWSSCFYAIKDCTYAY